MKANLLYGDGQKMSGFKNISSLRTDDEEIIWCDVRNLDLIIDDAEASLIIARDVVNYIPQDQMMPTLRHWIGKLRHGGRLVIGATDAYEVARQIHIRDVDIQQANEMLYGGSKETKKNIFQTEFMLSFFRDNNMTILKSRMDGAKMIIEVERP